MIGIEIGSSQITYSDGSHTPLDGAALPPDLLTRVARETACVFRHGNLISMQPASAVFASLVARAIKAGPHSTHQEFVLSVPGWWGAKAHGQVERALKSEGLNGSLINHAEALTVETRSTTTIPNTVVVVTAGAQHASAVIVDQCDSRPTALRTPVGVYGKGGASLDVLVLQHLTRGLDEYREQLETTNPATVHAARDMIPLCTAARERLSTENVTVVPVKYPTGSGEIRLLRTELEAVATPWCDDIISMVHATLSRSDLRTDTVILAGGLARMPLISQRISADLELEVIVPPHSDLVAARGALTLARESRKPERSGFSFSRLIRRGTPATRSMYASTEHAQASCR